MPNKFHQTEDSPHVEKEHTQGTDSQQNESAPVENLIYCSGQHALTFFRELVRQVARHLYVNTQVCKTIPFIPVTE